MFKLFKDYIKFFYFIANIYLNLEFIICVICLQIVIWFSLLWTFEHIKNCLFFLWILRSLVWVSMCEMLSVVLTNAHYLLNYSIHAELCLCQKYSLFVHCERICYLLALKRIFLSLSWFSTLLRICLWLAFEMRLRQYDS